MDRTTTIAVYLEDHRWLQKRQREISFEREKTVPMCDLIRELIASIQRAEAGA
jgi:hypothetical protein